MRDHRAIIAIWLLILSSGPAAYGEKPSGTVQALACAPTNPNIIITLSNDVVFTTTDRGRQWHRHGRLVPPPSEAADSGPTKQPVDWDDTAGELLWTASDSVLPDRPPSRHQDVFRVAHRSISLSINDHGVWAAAKEGLLFISGPDQGLISRRPLPELKGVAVDRHGRVFATAGDELLRLDPAQHYRTIASRQPLPGGGIPVPVGEGDALAIPSPQGVWLIHPGAPHDTGTVRLYPLGSVRAVAWDRTTETLLVLSDNALSRWSPGRAAVRLWSVRPGGIRVVVDGEGTVWLESADTNWAARTPLGWQPVAIRAVAADAQGLIWRGTAAGLVPPRTASSSVRRPAASQGRFETALSRALQRLESEVGPPPCPDRFHWMLPRARIFFRLDRGRDQQGTLPDWLLQTQQTTERFIGLDLAWQWSPVNRTSCRERQQQYQALRRRTAQKMRALWLARRDASRQPADLAHAIDTRIESLKQTELIRLHTTPPVTIEEHP